MKHITVKQLSSTKAADSSISCSSAVVDGVFREFIQESLKKKLSCQIVKHSPQHVAEGTQTALMHSLIYDYGNQGGINDCNSFLLLVETKMKPQLYNSVEKETRLQYKTGLWYELRYGRITASKAFEVMRCKTPDGSLVAAIMGAKFPDTAAIMLVVL